MEIYRTSAALGASGSVSCLGLLKKLRRVAVLWKVMLNQGMEPFF